MAFGRFSLWMEESFAIADEGRRERERQLASCERIIEEQLEKYGFTRPGGTVAMA